MSAILLIIPIPRLHDNHPASTQGHIVADKDTAGCTPMMDMEGQRPLNERAPLSVRHEGCPLGVTRHGYTFRARSAFSFTVMNFLMRAAIAQAWDKVPGIVVPQVSPSPELKT